MFYRAIPLLHVTDSVAARQFYIGQMGFELMATYRPFPDVDNPAYLVISRDGVELHLSSFSGDGVSGHAVNLLVDNVDALHDEFLARGIPVAMPPTDQSWGNREMYVRDADANSIRFLQPL